MKGSKNDQKWSEGVKKELVKKGISGALSILMIVMIMVSGCASVSEIRQANQKTYFQEVVELGKKQVQERPAVTDIDGRLSRIKKSSSLKKSLDMVKG